MSDPSSRNGDTAKISDIFRAPPDYPRWSGVADLIHRSFDYMEALLGHPARAMEVTSETLAEAASTGTAFLSEADGGSPIACVFTRPSRDMPDALYLGWLAVAPSHRGRGLSHRLISIAETEASKAGFAAMTLDTGRALTDLHGLFGSAGFQIQSGDDDIVTFRKDLSS
ncbi:MAG: GNAT family N-acetyltransferase [Pseudomonadota bacterium]